MVEASKPQRTHTYNRSSLAYEMEDALDEVEQPLPQLVPRAPVLAAAGAPTFGSLDTLTAQKDPTSKAVSFVVHVFLIAGVLYLGFKAKQTFVEPKVENAVHVTLFDPAPPPPKILPVAPKEGGGGGGGNHEKIEPIKGNPPKIVTRSVPVLAPQIVRLEHPKLAAEPTVMVKMPEDSKLPNLGMTSSTQVALASQGKGSGSGFGSGMGGGIGAGHGVGSGPGSGGGYGGGVMSVGGGVSAPTLVSRIDPEFTEEARAASFQGNVAIQLVVDQQGNPQNIRVVRRAGMGLDEKAMEAVRQYRFHPAMFQGHPVAVQIIIDVDFHLH